MNSKQKGSRGERQCRDIWKKHGYEEAHRSQQYSGRGESSADIEGIDPRLHIEVKSGYSFKTIYTFLEQAVQDAKEGQIPVVNCKMDRMPWLWVCYLDDGIEMWKEGHNVEVKTISMIVHCRDCKWNYYDGDNIFCLRLSGGHYGHTIQWVEEDFFCKYGERKNNDR